MKVYVAMLFIPDKGPISHKMPRKGVSGSPVCWCTGIALPFRYTLSISLEILRENPFVIPRKQLVNEQDFKHQHPGQSLQGDAANDPARPGQHFDRATAK